MVLCYTHMWADLSHDIWQDTFMKCSRVDVHKGILLDKELGGTEFSALESEARRP